MSCRRLFLPIVILCALVLLALPLSFLRVVNPALAQVENAVGERGSTLPTISVTGRGSTTVEPDMARFIAGVEVVADDLTSAQAEATQRMSAVQDALRAAGVPDEAIQTASFRVEVVRSEDQPPAPVAASEPAEPVAAGGPVEATPVPPSIQGFRVVNEVRVEVSDLDRLGAILDDVLMAGANTISGIELAVEDSAGAQRQARVRAIEDARTAAEALAMAADAQLGDILSIVADGASAPPQPMVAEAQVADSAVPIALGQTEVSVGVRVTYELLPDNIAGEATPATTSSS
ncbi:MAG: SIMPL domain-containing protein [Chloroflexi bacterium]|nr:SIMPL domain-containing protein [Chloroflexota bacterium]